MNIKKNTFTLIELIVSIAVFIVILAILLQSLQSIQKSVTVSKNTGDVFQNAIVALDIMSRDIQSIYYENSVTPFYHKGVGVDSDQYYNDALYFISTTSMPSEGSVSDICEIKYQLFYTDDFSGDVDTAGWILRSVTGDDNTSEWNFWRNDDYFDETDSNAAFTLGADSNEPYEKLIPNVTRLTFTCFSKDLPDAPIGTDEEDSKRTFPYSIEISMAVLDRTSWTLWAGIDNNHQDGESPEAADFRRKYERTFTKTVLVGDRGQYR